MMRLIAIMIIALALACAANAEVISPLAIGVHSVGGGNWNYNPANGAGQQGVFGGVGLNNIALLIRVWGKVTWRDTDNLFFYIDDGTGRQDGSTHLYQGSPVPNIGLRVSYDNLAQGNSITPPLVDQYVGVTGISSTVMINSKVQPNLRPRNGDDVQSF